jgi:hypothetical protein
MSEANVSPDRLTQLLSDTLEMGLGPRATSRPATPATGFSSPPPHDGGIEQGTYSGVYSGGVSSAFVSDLSSGYVSLSDSKLEPDNSKFGRAIAPVRLIKADAKFRSDYCCGVIGKSGKYCTCRRNGTGDTTCGTRVHIKKAPVANFYIYVWEETTNVAYLTPTMDSRVKLADEL